MNVWQKEMAPSNSLRKWNEFKSRYFKELDKNIDRYTEEHTNMEKINMKYLGTFERPLTTMLLKDTRNRIHVVIEITPKFFSSWNFGEVM